MHIYTYAQILSQAGESLPLLILPSFLPLLLPRSSRQVRSRTDTGCRRRPPAVGDTGYKSPRGTTTSVPAEAGGEAEGPHHTLAGTRGEIPRPSQMIFEMAETSSQTARRSRPKDTRGGRSAVSHALPHPAGPLFCPHPRQARLGGLSASALLPLEVKVRARAPASERGPSAGRARVGGRGGGGGGARRAEPVLRAARCPRLSRLRDPAGEGFWAVSPKTER